MNNSAANPASDYPSILKILLAGFDRISKHMWLVIFPILLDVFLWLGPRLPISGLINSLGEQMLSTSQLGTGFSSDLMTANQQVWTWIAEHFNLFVSVRTYPVGIPSHIAGRLPIETPLNSVISREILTIPGVVGAWFIISLAGLLIGTLFFQLVAQAALKDKVNLVSAITSWPRSFVRVLGVTGSLILLYLIVSLPASCLLLFAAMSGIGQCVFFMYAGFLVWLLFPFFLSAHGIFIHNDKVLKSVMRGAQISRMLIIPTSLLFIAILFITQGLDLLWNVTSDDSWLTLIGIIGHAFVTTALLASTFIYYDRADRWLLKQSLVELQNFT